MKRFCIVSILLVGGVVLAAGTIPDLVWSTSGAVDGDVAALPDGSVAAIGTFSGTVTYGAGEPNETTLMTAPGDEDYVVVRYGPDGLLAWARRIGGPDTSRKMGIAAFDDGSAVVAGNAGTGVLIDDPGAPGGTAPVPTGTWLARYRADGTLAWVRQGAAHPLNPTWAVEPASIASFPDGSFVLYGAFNSAWGAVTFGEGAAAVPGLSFDTSWDVFLARYDSAGTLIWIRQGGEQSGDWAHGIAGFPDGSFVVVGGNFLGGRFGIGEGNETDLPDGGFVARYNADGTLAWARHLEGPATQSGRFRVAALSDGSSAVAGYFLGSMTLGAGEPTETTLNAPERTVFVARFDANGGFLWARAPSGDADTRGGGITVLADGTLLFVGEIGDTPSQVSATFGAGEPCEATLVKPAGQSRLPFLARYAANGDFIAVRLEGGYGGGSPDAYANGAFVSKSSGGVRYYEPGDSDGDGLFDIWESPAAEGGGYTHTNGQFVDLYDMGARPDRKDVFVEIDTMSGITPPITGDDESGNPTGLDLVVAAFAAAPVSNPDGSNGITLHCCVDDVVPFDDVLGTGDLATYDWTEFDAIKAVHFQEELEWAVHYCVFANATSAANSGISRGIEASDFIVSLGTFPGGGTGWQHAGTFMHELGHNLGLGHGGADDVNGKPNYLSIMNKPFQMQGLRTLDMSGEAQDGLFDYSRQKIDLDESAINESLGLGPAAPGSYATTWFRFAVQHWTTDAGASAGPVNDDIDWDDSGFIVPIAIGIDVTDDGAQNLLEGHDDWANLVFTGGRVGGGVAPLPQVTEVGDELTLQEAQSLSLAPPTKLHGHVADGQKIVLTWKPVGPKKEASYKVYRGLPGGQPVLLGSSDNSNFDDPDVASGTTYAYYVTVVNALGVESSQAAQVIVEFP